MSSKIVNRATFAVIATVMLAACQKEKKPATTDETISEATAENSSARHNHENGNNDKGFVYTMSNNANANKVIVYRRSSNGGLTYKSAYSTNGKGAGAGLGSQGAVTLTDDGKFLLVVNAGSNSISSLRVTDNGLDLKCTINSGGIQPVSVTQKDNLVYVLNAGGNGNISGFRLNGAGYLSPVYYSTRPLSSNSAGPAEILFVNNGKVIVVTEKATNKIISYKMDPWGRPGFVRSITSANTTPFGFAEGANGKIFVSEAAGGASGASTVSSYRVQQNGGISLIQGPVGAGQAAACWVVVTDNQKYVYATNTGSNSVSSFKVSGWGGLDVKEAVAASSATVPIDAALSKDSKYLYVLNSGSHAITAYSVSNNGSLQTVQGAAGLPAFANGLAAY